MATCNRNSVPSLPSQASAPPVVKTEQVPSAPAASITSSAPQGTTQAQQAPFNTDPPPPHQSSQIRPQQQPSQPLATQVPAQGCQTSMFQVRQVPQVVQRKIVQPVPTAPESQPPVTVLPPPAPVAGVGNKRPASIAFAQPQPATATATATAPQRPLQNIHTTSVPTPQPYFSGNTNYSSTGSENSDEPIQQPSQQHLQQHPASLNNVATNGLDHNPAATGAGGKPPKLAPLNRSNKNLSEKKIRRLEKNRLSARNCRRKKKEYTQNLQSEILLLEGENLRLRLQLQIGQEAEQSSIKEQERVTEGIDEMLKSGASDPEIYNSIEMFKEKFADYGRDRRSAMEFHLRNAERLLMPTTTTSVAMRALGGGGGDMFDGTDADDEMQGSEDEEGEKQEDINTLVKEETSQADQDQSSTSIPAPGPHDHENEHSSETSIGVPEPLLPSATDASAILPTSEATIGVSEPLLLSATDTSAILPTTAADVTEQDSGQIAQNISKLETPEPKELFSYLVNFLQVTPEQGAALKDSRHVAKELDSALEKSLAMLGELRERLTDMGQNLDAEFSEIRSILTPRQAAKFLVWVANNGACMHMLNELWSKVYPEPVSNDVDDDDDDDDDNEDEEE